MRTLGLTLTAGLLLAITTGESKAQLTVANPLTGQGVTVGPGGVTPYNANMYNNGYNYARPGYGMYAPGTNYYNSGYRAPGTVYQQSYNYPGYVPNTYGYPPNLYRYPANGYRTNTYTGRTYRRGLFGLRRVR